MFAKLLDWYNEDERRTIEMKSLIKQNKKSEVFSMSDIGGEDEKNEKNEEKE